LLNTISTSTLEERALMSNVITPPTLTDTALVAGDNNQNGAITFTLTLQETTVTGELMGNPYTVQTITDHVSGDGFYSAKYTMPVNLTGNYSWTVAGSGLGGKVTSAIVYSANTVGSSAYADGIPVTQYWYYSATVPPGFPVPPASARNQPIGYWGTNPNYPPATVSTGSGTFYPTWQGPTYTGAAPTASTPAVKTMTVYSPVKETKLVQVCKLVKETEHFTVSKQLKEKGKIVTEYKLVSKPVLVKTYKFVKETVLSWVSKQVNI
jgi:hypothetical protein